GFGRACRRRAAAAGGRAGGGTVGRPQHGVGRLPTAARRRRAGVSSGPRGAGRVRRHGAGPGYRGGPDARGCCPPARPGTPRPASPHREPDVTHREDGAPMTASALPGQGRYSIYTGRVTNWPLVVALSAALMVPLLLLGSLSRGSWLDPAGPAIPLLIAAVAVLIIVLTGLSVRTAAGPNGVSVRCGVVGWPRRTYRLEEIERAEVVDLSPSLWRVS